MRAAPTAGRVAGDDPACADTAGVALSGIAALRGAYVITGLLVTAVTATALRALG